MKVGGSKHKLFLQWVVVNCASVVALILAYMLWWDRVAELGGAAKMVFVILVLAGGISAYLGRLCWRADVALERKYPTRLELEEIEHDCEHVWTGIKMLPYVGMLGSIAGFVIAIITGFEKLKSGAQPDQITDAIHHTANGAGAAMLSTFAGIFGALILWQMAHLMVHAIERGERRAAVIDDELEDIDLGGI